jgi:hypothetical protein
MRCTILSLVLCALATTTAAAAPGRHAKTSAAVDRDAAADDHDAAADDAVDAPDADDAAAARRSRKRSAHVARSARARHQRAFYFVGGVAHIEARVASGGLELDPEGLASLAAKPGPMQGSVSNAT